MHRHWMKRIDLPTFEGVDRMGWIARAEKFFEIQNISPKEKLRLAFISMEGNASHWFRFWKKKTQNHSWENFTAALIKRFGGKERCSVFEKLAALRQSGGVEEYVQEFEMLVSQITEISEDQLLGYFFAGLKSGIRNQIRPHDPKDLMRAMEIARDLEDSFKETRSEGGNSYRNNNSISRYQGGMGVISRTETYKGLGNSQSSSSNVSTARKEVGGGMLGSTKTGNSSGGNNKNRGV